MNFSKYLVALCMLTVSVAFGQQKLSILVLDSAAYTPVSKVVISIPSMAFKQLSNAKGVCTLSALPSGSISIFLQHVGFKEKEVKVDLPFPTEILTVLLSQVDVAAEENVLELTKMQRSAADNPLRTDLLTATIAQSASLEPSTMRNLLGRTTGVRIQGLSASSGSAVWRIQGLGGQYTQVLRDGFPMYGGLANGLEAWLIPPLDLKQIEYVKGAASSLHGNGAIGGVVNLVSKRPETNETMLHENLSTIGGRDFNAYVSKDLGKFGFTSLATLYMHRPYDADKDGFSDVPDVLKIHFSPRFFYYPNRKTELSLGGIITDDRRAGGDMHLIDRFNADSSHFYFDTQVSRRLSYQFSARHTIGTHHTLRLKHSLNSVSRNIQVRENAAGDLYAFVGKELGSFTELSYHFRKKVHTVNLGLHHTSNDFKEEEKDTLTGLRNQKTGIYGAFLTYVWDVHKAVALDAGVRADYATAQSSLSRNSGQFFLLPHLNALFRLAKDLAMRLGGGMGYRMPTLFNPESEVLAFQRIQAIDYAQMKAEQSYSGRFDLKYQSAFGSKLFSLSVNPSAFYNVVENPVRLTADSTGLLAYQSIDGQMRSAGLETQLTVKIWKFALFAGYTYTDAAFQDSTGTRFVPLTPQHSLKGELSFVDQGKWLFSWRMEYTSEQQISNGLVKPAYLTTGILAERAVGKFAIFANFENLTDFRQTRKESLVTDIDHTTRYAEIWAPLDGFFFNWGVKVHF